MELSDETSRSESSVSLGGGGGSLSGTAVKAGDFLEKNTRCHLGASRKKKTHQLSPWGKWEGLIAFLWPCLLRYRGMPGKGWGGKKDFRFQRDGEQLHSYLGSERLRDQKSLKSQHGEEAP